MKRVVAKRQPLTPTIAEARQWLDTGVASQHATTSASQLAPC